MEIIKPAKAGTMESNDIYIMVTPNDNKGIEIQLESIVMKQFGEQIRTVIVNELTALGVENVTLIARDRGALDYTIRARIETAIKRAI